MATNEILDHYSGLKRELNLILGQELKKFPFGHKQMTILYYLGRKGSMTMGELAEITQSDKATITRAIASLEESDLIRRDTDKCDSRKSNIQLSAKGRAQSDKAQYIRELIAGKINATLTAKERETAAALLSKIVTGLQAGRTESEN